MKKTLRRIFVALTVASAIYGVYASRQDVEMSDLAKANVEALAGGENGGIPYKGMYANWAKGGCCESGRWSDECSNYPCK